MSADFAIDGWLVDHGYGLPESRSAARAELEAQGLTRPGKTRISSEKASKVEDTLRAKFCLHCSDRECVNFAKGSGRTPLLCEPRNTCERCGGSTNRRAETEFLEACTARKISKVLVVGGSPAVREELERALGSKLQLRMVDGTERRPIERAKADMDWADVVLLWGASELHHKVSMQYTNASTELKRKMVNIRRRGVAALLAEGTEHLKR